MSAAEAQYSHPQIQTEIAQSDAILESLSELRAKLLTQLEETELRIKRESARRGRLANLLAPISLPPELLSTIFLICQDTTQSFPIIASHVCGYWRDVATSTPLLWANVRLRLSIRTSREVLDTQTDRLEAYLTRTNTSHFKVRVEINGNHDFSKIVECVAAHSDRCSHFHLSLANNPYAVETLRGCFASVEAPVLEHLSITVSPLMGHYDPRQFSIILPTVFASAPSLTFVRLTGVAGSLQPPLVNVTTLHVDGVHMSDLTLPQYRRLLAGLPSLVNLSLLEIGVIEPGIESLDPIPLPFLRSLRLRDGLDYQSVRLLLDSLPVEQIESLILSHVEQLDPSLFPNVRQLTFSACNFPVDQLGHIMLAFPSVQSFTIEIISSLMLIALGYPGTPVWWPHLKILTVREIQHVEINSLLELVRNRKKMEHPLEKVYLDKRSKGLLRGRSQLEELESMVSVERHHDTEAWPAGLGYEDEDDGFWLP
ncbi:hypothetical protein D9758_003960 [Tetrapyrgos nigripes]|uniref:F-box domain-containing protein n=1 Tax=Tetrapyrgos nigripes TaxID=182062 RepID=A0A8H5GLQ2_9AGAR|nr:hypothetical protein D9758_003960 [Tetrapyrgos nigripes]